MSSSIADGQGATAQVMLRGLVVLPMGQENVPVPGHPDVNFVAAASASTADRYIYVERQPDAGRCAGLD